MKAISRSARCSLLGKSAIRSRFHLSHPRTMNGRVMKDEPRVLGQPRLHLLALVHPPIVQDDVDRLHRRGNLLFELLQEREELRLPLPRGRLPVDLPRPRVEGGEQIQRPTATVLVFDSGRLVFLRGPGRCLARARLQTGHLIDTQDYLIGPQRPRVQVADLLNLLGEGRVARHLGRQPHLLPPRLETMVEQDLTSRLRRDRRHYAVALQLARDLGAIPLAQRASDIIRPFAGDLHHVQRDRGGKRPACGRVRDDHVSLRVDPSGTAGPPCARASPSGRPSGQLRPEGVRRRPLGSRDTAEPSPAKLSWSEDAVPVDSAPPRSRPRATTSCDLSSVPPCGAILGWQTDIMTENRVSGNSSPYFAVSGTQLPIMR